MIRSALADAAHWFVAAAHSPLTLAGMAAIVAVSAATAIRNR